MPDRPAPEARASLFVESLLVGGAISGDVSLLAAVEAICQRVLLFLAFFVGMVLRAAFVAKSSLGGGALAEQVLPGSALETSLLMPLLVLQLGQFLLLSAQLLLDSLVLLTL